VTNSDVPEKVPDKPISSGLLARLRGRLRAVIPAFASVAAVGAIAGGLVGYWNVWKTVRTDVFQGGQKTLTETAARPDLAPRLSLVVLPFVNLNNDPEQDYFADAITTDLTTDLARMRGVFVIGRDTAFTYKNKPIDLKTLGKDLGIRWAVHGAVRRNGDQIRSTFRLRIFRLLVTFGRIVSMAIVRTSLSCKIRSRRGSPARSTLNSSKPKAAAAKQTDQGSRTLWISTCGAWQSPSSRRRRHKMHRQGPYSTVRCNSTRTMLMR